MMETNKQKNNGQLHIYRSMKSNHLTQRFGQSLACAKTDINGRLKIPTTVVSKWNNLCPSGFKDFYKLIGMKSHNGTDWACWEGEPIYFKVDAPCEWWVRNEIDADGGQGIDVFSDRPIDIGDLPDECGKLARSQFEGNYGEPKYGYEKGKVFIKFRWWHLSKSLVSDSKNNVAGKPEGYRECKVKFGDLIAFAGNSGASSAAHSHENMKIVTNNSCTLDGDNGWNGAVDDSRYTENVFVGDVLKVKQQALTAIGLARKVIFNVQQFINSLLINK